MLHVKHLTIWAQCLLLALTWPAVAFGAEPLRIGVLTDLSSFGANVTGKGSLTAARMAVADVHGEAGGHPIIILSADSQNKPDVAAGIAREWFDRDHVDAIVDVPQTAVALAVQDIARSRKKALLITSAVTQDLTGKACSPTTIHWADDTNALASGTGRAVVAMGDKSWFFITADFAFGTTMQEALRKVIEESGGNVIGAVRAPTNTSDYSAYLISAQSSGARTVGLVVVGSDLVTTVKQAHEFGVTAHGQQIVAPIIYLSDIYSLGLDTAQGLLVTTGFYWDDNDATRAFSTRFHDAEGRMPNQTHASTYAALRAYFAAVDAANSTDATVVLQAMKGRSWDFLGKPASIEPNGRVVYDLGLYRVKRPSQSHGEWDLYEKLALIKGSEAFLTAARSGCTASP